MYIDNLDYIVNKYNNTYHNTIKMKPTFVKSSTLIDFDEKNDKKDPRFKVGNRSRISKVETFHVPNWSEEVFVIKKS